MRKEIGSEFWDIPTQDNENLVFSKDTKWFVSGRSALDFILKDILSKRRIKTVAMPSWCCDTMIEPILRNKLEVVFYSVLYKDNKLTISSDIEADVFIKLDYFGYETNNKNYFKGIVIKDISHSVFNNNNIVEDYCFGSLRKWAGFKTGGFAYSSKGFDIEEPHSTNNEYISLRSKAMQEKEKYINNKVEDKSYLNIYAQAEDMLNNLYMLSGDKQDIYDAKHLNIDFIKQTRKDNAKKLLEDLNNYAIFKTINDNDCPLFVPIIVPNNKRNYLRKYLINNNVYCPIHWPISNLHKLNKEEEFLYDNELSIICDQRYNTEDMEYIAKLVKEFIEC